MHIFISYRRDDSFGSARLLYNELAKNFEAGEVFMDIENIGYGDDFVQKIDADLDRADVVIVVIGPRWSEMMQSRQREDDWVRYEIARALKLRAAPSGGKEGRLRVLPILVGGAEPPGGALPADIARLKRLSMPTFSERSLHADLNNLIETINKKSFRQRTVELIAELRGRTRAQIIGVVVGAVMFLAAWIALFDGSTLDTRLESATMRLASIGRSSDTLAPWSGQVVLVGIDEGTLKALGRKGIDSSWRGDHARIIENAAAAGARSVAFDIFLIDKGSDEKANLALERALMATRANMPVVFAVEDMNGHTPEIQPRFEKLAHWGIACGGRTLGLARSMLLAVRRESIPPLPESAPVEKRFITYPSLALAAFSAGGSTRPFKEHEHVVQVLLARGAGSVQVGFYATESVRSRQSGCGAVTKGDLTANQLFDPWTVPPLRDPPQRLAYERVLAGDVAATSLLKDKIVLVGALLENVDKQNTASGERWGAELLADQIDAMTRNAAIRQLGWVTQWLLTSAFGLLGAIAAFRMRHLNALGRRTALVALALLCVAAGVVWYRVESQLIGLPYGLGALLLGAWAAVALGTSKPK